MFRHPEMNEIRDISRDQRESVPEEEVLRTVHESERSVSRRHSERSRNDLANHRMNFRFSLSIGLGLILRTQVR